MDISSQILNDIETDKIIALAADPIAFNAVKKYILAVVYKHGVVQKDREYIGTVNFALNLAWGATAPNGVPRTDEELGQNLRALTYATQLVESGFKEMSEMKGPDGLSDEETVNPTE